MIFILRLPSGCPKYIWLYFAITLIIFLQTRLYKLHLVQIIEDISNISISSQFNQIVLQNLLYNINLYEMLGRRAYSKKY